MTPRTLAFVLLGFALWPCVLRAQPRPIDPDGDDDPADTGVGTLPATSHFERVGRGPHSLRRVCDLTPFAGALYAAHANTPLGSDGATITRYAPAEAQPFTVAFDWNRLGQPTRGGGGGQGFVRVHSIGGRLFVPDADPPYNGFGITDSGTEGYVFISDPAGHFAPARGPTLRPPGPPDATARPGAGVLPRAYHVLDVIRFRGSLYASTGSVPPREQAWSGPSPGALHRSDPSLSRWTYAVDYPHPWQAGVWRLGSMVRFRDRLYAGIQDYDGRETNDYVVFTPPPSRNTLEQADLHPTRVTTHGGVLTLRWFADNGHLYWIGYHRDEGVRLRVTDDGDHWREVLLPVESGAPADLIRFLGTLLVLCERGLYRLDGEVATRVTETPLDARGQSPFAVTDIFCAAPLAVFENALYAGSQRDGSLWRLTDGPAPAAPPPTPNAPRR